jgi:outer membrane protein assembly factor BamB
LSVLGAGCGGGQGGTALPGQPTSAPHSGSSSANVTFTITVPAKSTSSAARRPAYVSPSTQSISLAIYASGSSTPVFNQTANVTSGSPGCTTSASGTVCSVAIYLAPGQYTADVTAYDGTNGSGSVLSQGQQEGFTAPSQGTTVIALTLYGVPASLKVTPSSTAVQGSVAGGFIINAAGLGGSQLFTITALDADGNTIVGPGAPTFSIANSNQRFSLTQPSTNTPNQFIVTPPNVIGGNTNLTATAAFADSTTCQQPGAVCSTSFVLTYAPFDDDDWATFAHDNLRTGLQKQSTGISSANVSKLKLRWQTTISGGGKVDASVLAYKGRVIIVGSNGIIYNFNAADGSLIWKQSLGSGTFIGTPTMDTQHGVIFVMNRIFNATTGAPMPSSLFALNWVDGSVVWQTTLPGPMRAAPVYANGIVYEGWAGGDAPTCINGGVSAINATTGSVVWTYLTNSGYTPGGGGVWGALAFDGQHVFFGTGNTCYTEPLGHQGVVAVNTNGSAYWLYTAEQNSSADLDTGGGVLIQNGQAAFMNKDGSLYTLNQATGAKLSAIPLGATEPYGGFASPTSDGSTVFVGAGFIPTSTSSSSVVRAGSEAQSKAVNRASGKDWMTKKPYEVAAGYMSYLRAINSSGTVVWSIPMTNTIINYVGINNGLVFAGVDDDVEAINISTGGVLWSYSGAAAFQAGPAIVPSGVYDVDVNGDVYAFNEPSPPIIEIQSAVRTRR